MARSGRAFTHLPHALVRHEGSVSSGMGRKFYETRMVAARFLLARKLARGHLDYGIMIFAHFLTLTAGACLRAWRYRRDLPLCALVDGWHIVKGDDPLQWNARDQS
jgi:hypothetical protein